MDYYTATFMRAIKYLLEVNNLKCDIVSTSYAHLFAINLLASCCFFFASNHPGRTKFIVCLICKSNCVFGTGFLI